MADKAVEKKLVKAYIEVLADKIKSDMADDALKYTQAAQNAAHTICVLNEK